MTFKLGQLDCGQYYDYYCTSPDKLRCSYSSNIGTLVSDGRAFLLEAACRICAQDDPPNAHDIRHTRNIHVLVSVSQSVFTIITFFAALSAIHTSY